MAQSQNPEDEVRALALHAWQIADPIAKCAQVDRIDQLLAISNKAADQECASDDPAQRAVRRGWIDPQVRLDGGLLPGRPLLPTLVSPRRVAKRPVGTTAGRAALLHALAHIEFNAINLALDAVWRFADMPQAFYRDWCQVAVEEALHFRLLVQRLEAHQAKYGDFDAHNTLWEMAERTHADVLARMALVPRTLEARGLDASPPIRARLADVGDLASAQVLDIILRDEIGHVAIGNRWFGWLCQQRGLERVSAYRELALQHRAPVIKGPVNEQARLAAGFEPDELKALLAERSQAAA